jgi:hypothetical protein
VAEYLLVPFASGGEENGEEIDLSPFFLPGEEIDLSPFFLSPFLLVPFLLSLFSASSLLYVESEGCRRLEHAPHQEQHDSFVTEYLELITTLRQLTVLSSRDLETV